MNAIFRPLFSLYTKNSIEAVINEFAITILEEISLKNELENLKKFSAVYKDSGIKFPSAYPQYSSDDAIVMSFEEGCRFDDRKTLLSWNIDFRPLIDTLVRFYTEQMLVRGYFHADPHPGNLLVNKKGELILLDFGMVKSVPKHTRIAIIELIKAANERDYDVYIAASKKLGTIAYEAPKAQLAEFTEKMFDIFGDESLSAKSMQTLAFGVMESTAKLPFKLPQEAIYILRVSAIIEGLGTTYIENFNGIKDILPILQNNIPRALGDGKTPLELLKEEILSIPLALKNLKEVLKAASDGELKVEMSPYQLEWLQKELNDGLKPVITGFLLLIGGVFALLFDPTLKPFALVMFVAGVLRLIYR
jgi:predicted unusual protein kinase regulating ubiquinone biosynthesis (AarF/ABC1/UbiB family)